MRGSEADLVTTAIVAASRVPFPQSLQKSGNCYPEAHRLSRFRDHRTAWSCLLTPAERAAILRDHRIEFWGFGFGVAYIVEYLGFMLIPLVGCHPPKLT